MANTGRPGRLLLAGVSAAACMRLLTGTDFVPSPHAAPEPPVVAAPFNPSVVASAALPALTFLADDAEAKYGDARKWSSVLVPLTTLV
eukprot:CAMPEP_0197922100 /NCGR_PEP_ID=MMETSP1439-20131203/91775_1 /TAXON_ID=66791 /ORGANISM="Gonyaulax spinifera, Strain CCMP409" /LENGTH=87 /DNA_ID=CAMNT_0043544389 /DNA_START=56 /DNA_END=316 /DNA_ORIENTATION=-